MIRLYRYNEQCPCEICVNQGAIPTDTPSNGHSFGYDQPHIPPTGYRDQTAVIGHAPESRDHTGPGIPPNIHPTARLEAYVTVDAGTERATHIGARAWLLKHAHAGHDAYIGEDTEISTGAIIGGHATIHPRAHIGINAAVLPYRHVGPDAKVGAGSVVTHDIPAGETWAGNPARHLPDHKRDPRPHTERDRKNGPESKPA